MNIGVLRGILPPPDRRSETEIEAELDDEFAFHIEQIERELKEAGIAHAEARLAALARFGNVDRIKKRCKRIVMEERVMLQQINAVLMVIVLITVAFLSVQVYTTQRYNTLALQDITTQLTKMRLDAALEARDRGWVAPGSADEANQSGSDQSNTTRILVAGDIESPGWQQITLDRVTYVHEMLERVGAPPEQWVRHVRADAATQPTTVPAEEYLGDRKSQFIRPGDEIHIADVVADDVRRRFTIDMLAKLDSLEFVQADEDNEVIPGGWRLVGNVAVQPGGGGGFSGMPRHIRMALDQPGMDESITLYLEINGVRVPWRDSGHRGDVTGSDWSYSRDGVLILDLRNMTRIPPQISVREELLALTEPLRFVAASRD